MIFGHRRVQAQTTQEILLDDPSFLREIVERVVQQILEVEMTERVGAAPYERAEKRTGRRNGHTPRALRTRVGRLNLLVPQDREGTFSTRLFARYQRDVKALCLALMEMYVEGVSTRKVKEITEELCGTSFSKSLFSLAGSLDSELGAWRNRGLEAAESVGDSSGSVMDNSERPYRQYLRYPGSGRALRGHRRQRNRTEDRSPLLKAISDN